VDMYVQVTFHIYVYNSILVNVKYKHFSTLLFAVIEQGKHP